MPFRGFVSDCRLCKTTKAVCFWRPGTPYNRRKRELLPILSAILLFLVALPWYVADSGPAWLLVIVSTMVGPLAVLGLAAAYLGCDRCVVRLLGDL
jgi:hypothetical protein